jgi:hypothetical protein
MSAKPSHDSKVHKPEELTFPCQKPAHYRWDQWMSPRTLGKKTPAITQARSRVERVSLKTIFFGVSNEVKVRSPATELIVSSMRRASYRESQPTNSAYTMEKELLRRLKACSRPRCVVKLNQVRSNHYRAVYSIHLFLNKGVNR